MDRFAAALHAGWDWPVAGCSTLAEFVELAIVAPRRRFFWLLGDDQPLGFFGFAQMLGYASEFHAIASRASHSAPLLA